MSTKKLHELAEIKPSETSQLFAGQEIAVDIGYYDSPRYRFGKLVKVTPSGQVKFTYQGIGLSGSSSGPHAMRKSQYGDRYDRVGNHDVIRLLWLRDETDRSIVQAHVDRDLAEFTEQKAEKQRKAEESQARAGEREEMALTANYDWMDRLEKHELGGYTYYTLPILDEWARSMVCFFTVRETTLWQTGAGERIRGFRASVSTLSDQWNEGQPGWSHPGPDPEGVTLDELVQNIIIRMW